MLESRQLLSIGQTGLAAGVLVNPSAASPQISIPVTVSNLAPSNFAAMAISFGTFGGLNQIQIFIPGGGPAFSPTPSGSFGSSGSGQGTLSASSGNLITGTSVTSGTIFTSPITPLNPSATSTAAAITNTPVNILPPALVSLAIHLGASSGPATTILNSEIMSFLDERPPIMHFGQGDVFGGRRLFTEPAEMAARSSSSLIDFVEPFRTIAPGEARQAQPAQQGEQAPAPDAATLRPLPPMSNPDVDAALDLTDARVLTRSRDGDASQSDDQLSSTNTSWSFSAIFGAAAVATGGYHLAMREADRFRGRWIPRWQGAERPTKRKAGSPSR
jgi:hypothetical protein